MGEAGTKGTPIGLRGCGVQPTHSPAPAESLPLQNSWFGVEHPRGDASAGCRGNAFEPSDGGGQGNRIAIQEAYGSAELGLLRVREVIAGSRAGPLPTSEFKGPT